MRGLLPQERLALSKCQGTTTVHSNGDVYVPQEYQLTAEDMAVLPLLVEQGRVSLTHEFTMNNVKIPLYTTTNAGLWAMYLDKIINSHPL
jgi:hypothetical protein